MGSYEVGGYNLGNGFIDPSDSSARHIKQRKDDFYQANYPANSALWAQGYIDKRFKAGDQSLYNIAAGNNYNQSSYRFFFNLMRRHINMITGFQRRNRKSTITLPIHDDDDALTDDYNAVLRWCENRDGFQEYLSQAFEGSCDTGMTLLYMYPDYTKDPVSGDLMTDAVSYNNFLIDSMYRKQDLSDCNGIWRRRWVSKEVGRSLVPQFADEIKRMKPSGAKDGRFQVQAELQNIAANNLFPYDEFHYLTTREATMIIDPYTGESMEWEPEVGDTADTMNRVLSQTPWMQVKKMQIPTVKLSLAIGDREIYDGANLLNIDSYPCVPSLCYYDADISQYSLRCMGILRGMRDCQFLYNMRKCIELEILQSQINSGWIYPVDAVTDVKAFRQTGQGFHIPLKAGRLPSEIQRLDPPAIPQSLIELSQLLAEDMTKISGVNEELLGSATDDKAGILSMLRQGAGLTTLQTIFDKLDYTQRLYGDIRLKAIRKNFSKGKVAQILGREPDPRFFLSHSLKYSIAVEEGNYSATQRQTELQQLLYFKELGMGIADKTIIRKAVITDKREVMADMEEMQQQQMQAQQAESEQKAKVDQSKMMQAFSKSKLDMAKAEEAYSKIEENKASAEHKLMQADYELVKTAMELEDTQFNQVRAAFDLALAIKQANQPQEATV